MHLFHELLHYCHTLPLCQSYKHQKTFSAYANNKFLPPSLTEECVKRGNSITFLLIFKVTYLLNYCKYNKFPWNYNFQSGLDKQIKNNIQRLYQTYDYSAFEYIKVKVSTLFFFKLPGFRQRTTWWAKKCFK